MPANATESKRPKLEPLKVSCDTTDCEHGLHCFRTSKQKAKHPPGTCCECGADLVGWHRVKRRDIADVVNTFDELKKEWIRHHYWHEPIDRRAMNNALRKGRAGLRRKAPNRIRSSIGRAQNYNEGRQTPWTGQIMYYAQHATATCCRRCVEYWHGIPQSRDLTDAEVEYCSELCLRYLFERLPALPEEGQSVPGIRQETT